ncbi:DUF4124 domain-containing protein [Neptunomonas japonica]|uniref:DUF4124 domain-containing protein n=1 Tax=Neptunomonas japonica TaxID=417574 RepID=UPI001915F531|nr:DUF4124 domain-containing protein [Neptunomonas japonica]
MFTFRLKIGVLLICLMPLLASAEIYRWTDENGKIHYSDKAPVGVKAEKKTYVNVATPWRKIPKPEVPSEEGVQNEQSDSVESPSAAKSNNEELSADKSDKKNNKKTKRLKVKDDSSSSDGSSVPARLNQKDKSSSTPAKRAADIKKTYKKAKENYNKTK